MSVEPLTKLTRTIGATQVLGNATVVSIDASPSVESGTTPVVAAGVVFESAPQKSAAEIPVTGPVVPVNGPLAIRSPSTSSSRLPPSPKRSLPSASDQLSRHGPTPWMVGPPAMHGASEERKTGSGSNAWRGSHRRRTPMRASLPPLTQRTRQPRRPDTAAQSVVFLGYRAVVAIDNTLRPEALSFPPDEQIPKDEPDCLSGSPPLQHHVGRCVQGDSLELLTALYRPSRSSAIDSTGTGRSGAA
jgi:hypothetical protein